MAQANFLIGIGGTGARCVESFLHMAAAGLGPGEFRVGLVDQDASNGNVARTRKTLDRYISLRRTLRREGRDRLAPQSAFLAAAADRIGDTVWTPRLPDGEQTLDIFLQRGRMQDQPELRSLLDSLYSPDELAMPLRQGYRGRPSIGAAVLAATAAEDDVFWVDLVNRLREAPTGARVFFVGSIFGGTGAAGFPTLARLLRRHPDLTDRTGISIGGALMLPYFLYRRPGTDDGQLRAYSDVFVKNTEGALKYYNEFFAAHTTYDSLYVVGASRPIVLPYMDDGGAEQINPPMGPELYAALAAMRHFTIDRIEGRNLYHCARANAAALTWDDLTPITDEMAPESPGGRDHIRRSLIGHLRFCILFNRVYRPALSEHRDQAVEAESWYRRLVSQARVSLDPQDQEALDQLNEHARDYMNWCAGLQLAGGGSTLFDIGAFATDSQNVKTPVKLKSGPPDELDTDAFARAKAGAARPDMAAVFESLTYDRIEREHQRLGRFVGMLHETAGR